MSIPRLSVVIPTYNRLHMLPRALESVRRQTKRPDEIIVVDDASSDGTVAWLRNLNTSTVRYIALTQRSGANVARNVGIDAASGDIIAFLDSDDEWLSEKLASQTLLFRRGTGVIYGAVYESWGRRFQRRRDELYVGRVTEKLAGGWSPAIMSTVAAERELLEQEMFDEGLWGFQDYDLLLRLSRLSEFDACSEPVAIIHNHPAPRVSQDFARRGRALHQLRAKWAPIMAVEGLQPEFDRACSLWEWQLGWNSSGGFVELPTRVLNWVLEGLRMGVPPSAIGRRLFRNSLPSVAGSIDKLRQGRGT